MAQQCEPLPVLLPDKSPEEERDCVKEQVSRKMYADIAPATARIVRPEGTGSGFFINDGSEVVTNAHVVNGTNEPLTIETYDHKTLNARIEKLDDINDLAVLKLENGARSAHTLKLGSSTALEKGNPLFGVGHPLGLSTTSISPGKYASQNTFETYGNLEPDHDWTNWVEATKDPDPAVASDAKAYLKAPRIESELQLEPGSSGSPITNERGEVVAVEADGYERPDLHKFSISVPVEKLKDLLSERSDKFNFDYGRVSFAHLHPIFTGVVSAGVAGVTLAAPRFVGTVGGLMSAIDLCSHFSKKQNPPKDIYDKIYNAVDIASEVSLVAGGVLSWIPSLKPIGLAAIGIGVAGELGESLIPHEIGLRSVKRTNGSDRPPLFWDSL